MFLPKTPALGGFVIPAFLSTLLAGILTFGCGSPEAPGTGCGENGHFSEIVFKERLPALSSLRGQKNESQATIRLTYFAKEEVIFKAFAKIWKTREDEVTERLIHREFLEPKEYCRLLHSLTEAGIWNLLPGPLWEVRDVLDNHYVASAQRSLKNFPDDLGPYYKDPTFREGPRAPRVQTVSVRNGSRLTGFSWIAVSELKDQRYTGIVEMLRDFRRERYDQAWDSIMADASRAGRPPR